MRQIHEMSPAELTVEMEGWDRVLQMQKGIPDSPRSDIRAFASYKIDEAEAWRFRRILEAKT